jgi:hypothetical protein
VAFLTINKLSFTLGLYYELQGYLSKMNQSAMELGQLACSMTRGYQNAEYKEWRSNVILQTLTLLKATVAMIYKQGKDNVWELPEFDGNPLLLSLESVEHHQARRISKAPHLLFSFDHQAKSDRNLLVPIRVAHRLRDAIMDHRNFKRDPIDTIQEKTLLDLVKDFMTSYHGVRKYLTCPLPLPLIQLGRIFVAFYVYCESDDVSLPGASFSFRQCESIFFFPNTELIFILFSLTVCPS